MAHAITGHAGAVTMAATAVTGKLREWNLRLTSNEIDDRGAGESWASRIATVKDWEATFMMYVTDTTEFSPYGTTGDLTILGTDIAIALKMRSADTNPFFTDTGLVTNIERTHALESPSEFRITVKSSAGDVPTMDTTPAS
jgi:hypothetical protein